MKLYYNLFVWGIMAYGSLYADNNQNVLAQEYKMLFSEKIDTAQDLLVIFPKTVDDIYMRVEQAKAYAEKELQALYAIKAEERTFENSIQAIDRIQSRFYSTSTALLMLLNMSPDADILRISQQESDRLKSIGIDIFLDKKLYHVTQEYLDNQGKTEALDSEQRYFLSEQMAGFKRAGFTLPDETFANVKAINKQLDELSTQFEVNINTTNVTVAVAPKDASGISQKMLDACEKDINGCYIIPCTMPCHSEVMQECHVSQTRKLMARAYNNRGYPENITLLDRIIALRDDLAHLTGYSCYAALDIEPMMAKTPKRVQTFLTELAKKSRTKWLKEIQEYFGYNTQTRVNNWDVPYLFSQQKKKSLAIDNNEIAEYFEVQKTLRGIFDLYQTALGLRFSLKKPSWSWHSDVDMLEIYDATTNEYIGALLLDLYPRPNKCGHAFYDTIIPAQRGKASLAVILANIPKAMGDTPALFKHNDVVTFFHEFGHAMHGALGRTRLASCSGTSVARDFVEVPSQAFEEWMFNKATLKKLSCHYKTGQPLPDNVIENIEKSITFDSGLFLLRQCILSQISLNYALPGSQKDTDIIWQNAYQTLMPEIVLDPLVHPQASFGHLIWYQSKYYSYMWSKVMALDVFAQLEKENLSGKRFVACVLSKGGSQGPNILIKDYLGREPSMDAFLQILGIR